MNIYYLVLGILCLIIVVLIIIKMDKLWLKDEINGINIRSYIIALGLLIIGIHLVVQELSKIF